MSASSVNSSTAGYFDNTINQLQGDIDGTASDANKLVKSDKEMETSDLLNTLQETFKEQERVSLLSNVIKAMHDMNNAVIQSFK